MGEILWGDVMDNGILWQCPVARAMRDPVDEKNPVDEKLNIDELSRHCKRSPAYRGGERVGLVFDRRDRRLQYTTWPNAGMVVRLPDSGGAKSPDQLRYATNKEKVRLHYLRG
ncbi:MAG: hypothetical protein QGF59_12850 [Pirellulaceae bacterium]|jgi:hypothetical protein|nr:hypothetical protein [Pirellulaceae bacterium]